MFSLVDRKLTSPVLVVGLGRFGSSLALSLVEEGRDVLAVDTSDERVQHYADRITHVLQVDTTDEEAMRQIGVADFAQAIVAIGSDIESSVLTTALLADFGVQEIWAKAISREHGRILERIGAHHVVHPEADMGERVAHLVSGRILDYVEIDEGFSLVKAAAPHKILGRPLGRVGMRQEHGVTVVAVKQPEGSFVHATQETVLQENDIIVVAGKTEDVDRFTKAG